MAAKASGYPPHRSRWTLAALLLIWAGFALVLHGFAPLFNAVRVLGFPLGFYLAAQGALIVFALLGFWAASPWRQREGPSFGAVLSGMSMAGLWISGATSVAIVGALYAYGYDGLSFVLGFSGGFVIIACIIAPAFSASGSASLEEFLSHRTGSSIAAGAATLMLIVCLILLVSAELEFIRRLAAPLSGGTWSNLALAAAVLAAIAVALTRSLLLIPLHALSYLLMFCIVTLAACAMSLIAFDVAVPQLAFGLGLQDLAALERRLILDGVSDPSVVRPFVQPNTSFSRENFLALTLSLMLGAAAMPQLLNRLTTPGAIHAPRQTTAWALFFVVSLLITLPAVATFAKLDIYTAIARAVTAETTPAWLGQQGYSTTAPLCAEGCADPGGRLHVEDVTIDPEAILPSAAAIARLPSSAGWPLAAALALAAVLAAGYGIAIMTRSLGFSAARLVPVEGSPRRGRGRLATLATTIALAGLAALMAVGLHADLMTRISWSVSLAASGLFPMLFLAAVQPRANAVSLAAGGLTGFAVALYYIVGTQAFPIQFLMLWHEYSNMPEWRLEAFEEVRQNCLDGVAGACAETEALARELANWWGIDTRAVGVIGAPVGLVAACITSLPTALRRAHA